MYRCAFLTLSDPSGFVIDDDLAHEPLKELGWTVEAMPWSRAGVDWTRFDAVVVRSTWDYQRAPDLFLEVLREIASSGVPLYNPLDLIRWNLSKGYLLQLAEAGVPTVPTLRGPRMEPGTLEGLLSRIEAPEIVVKPDVGAGAEGTYRIARDGWRDRVRDVESYFSDRPFLAQAFIPSVTDEGEWSLIYFNGAYSHSILKIPEEGDFRTQEEFGAEIRSVQPERSLRRIAERALAVLPRIPLYARADLVRSPDREVFWLMELELIEPSLYLRTDPEAPARFARALRDVHRTREREGKRGHAVSYSGGGGSWTDDAEGEPEPPEDPPAVVIFLALLGGPAGPAAALLHESGWLSVGPPATLWPVGFIVLAALAGLGAALRLRRFGNPWLGLAVAVVNGLVLIPYLFLLLFFGLGGSR